VLDRIVIKVPGAPALRWGLEAARMAARPVKPGDAMHRPYGFAETSAETGRIMASPTVEAARLQFWFDGENFVGVPAKDRLYQRKQWMIQGL
jgi:hypothetical protein